eukprot:5983831-Ditylum_brightwellii.AAC.2
MNNGARTDNNVGRGHGHGGCSNGGLGRHNIDAVGNFKNQTDNNSPQNGNGNHGGKNECGFGRGAYGHQNFHPVGVLPPNINRDQESHMSQALGTWPEMRWICMQALAVQ